jgi:hypothetical protein
LTFFVHTDVCWRHGKNDISPNSVTLPNIYVSGQASSSGMGSDPVVSSSSFDASLHDGVSATGQPLKVPLVTQLPP